jgi:hypothetical protein
VKYDRPVWQIMHECADAMPDRFRYEDVREWFSLHYPDVNDATIRAHMIGLTQGGRAKHVQFAQRSPVFRRVARGEYTSIPLDDRGESPSLETPPVGKAPRKKIEKKSGKKVGKRSTTDSGRDVPDVVLLGSVGDRVDVPALAKDAFREISFQLSRLDAELSGADLFILSAEHGLLAPDEWMSPDSHTLADMDPDYRAVWASWVVTRLGSLVGSLEGKLVRVDAPDPFTGPLLTDLAEAGAVVSSDHAGAVVPPLTAHNAAADQHPAESSSGAGIPASLHLSDLRNAVPASDVSGLPTGAGLYGWLVDPVGARELSHCVTLPVRAGLIFVGQVGGSGEQSLADPVGSLRDHVERVQLHGRSRSSAFRMTLATVLREHLGMTSLDDPRLTAWMVEHLSISVWPSDDVDGLRELEQLVVTELDPPLNVDHLPGSEYLDRLNHLRSAITEAHV